MKFFIPTFIFFFCICATAFSQGYSDQSVASGVGFTHTAHIDADEMPMGAGSAWFDYNNDGYLDLYVCNRIGANKFFKNNGDGTFNEVASSLGISDSTHDGAAVAIGDINNDGYQDLYVGNSDEDVLYLNNQGNSFTDITTSSGIGSMGPNRATSGSFGDYNGDGYLDLYVTHHVGLQTTGEGSVRDYLFMNNGDKTFTDVSYHLDTTIIQDPGFASSWVDYDKDGDPDLIVVNDCPFGSYPNQGTFVFENKSGTDGITDWQFTEDGAGVIEDDCANGMGLGIGDYNRDGYMDVTYSNVGPARLFKNISGVYEEQASAGVSNQPFTHFSWGTSFMDFDNDGFQDIVMAIGALFNSDPDPTQECNFFQNNGDETFTEIGATIGVDDTGRTRSIVSGDYDNDGDLDLLMHNYGGDIKLLRNDEVNSNKYLRIKLRSKKSPPDGIGSWIEILTDDGVTQYFEMRSGSNLGGGDEIFAHFGLGTATLIEEIKVSWMSGEESILTNVPVDTSLIIREPTPYIYVRQGATGDADGSDWANAYAEVTTALSVASPGDTILVADGTYYPTNSLDEEVSFEMQDSVHLIGGFPATGGTFVERDSTGENTILSGFIGQSTGASNRSYNVIEVGQAVTFSCMNGFTITEGQADGAAAKDKQGGAIFCEGYLELDNIKMTNNTAELAGSNICTSGADGKLIIKNALIIVDDLSNPAISVDLNSEVHVDETCTIEED